MRKDNADRSKLKIVVYWVMTPISERLQLALDEEYTRMQNEWFFKWHFIGRDGPVEIDSFRGKPIRYGGIAFFGSPEQVYWQTIQLYARKKVASTLDNLEAELKEYSFDVRVATLQEAEPILNSFISRIRTAAIDKDRILRGNGFDFPPKRDLGHWDSSSPEYVSRRLKALRDIYCDPKISIMGVEMPIKSLMRDKVTFTKKDGTVVKKDIPASVQTGLIITQDVSLAIEVGDHFLRQLPSGLAEDFIVLDPGFLAGGSMIGAHFQTKVRRSDEPAAPPNTVINNIVGHNTRVNINSVDQSRNVVLENSYEIFEQLQSVLDRIEDFERRELYRSAISEMAESHKRSDSSFKDKYKKFISLAAEHMTLFAPFLPALAALL